MQCDEFEPHINELLDRRASLDADEEVALHAASCGACAGILAGYRALAQAMDVLPAAPVDEALTWRVRQELRRPPARRTTWRWPLAAAAAAAVALVAWPRLDFQGHRPQEAHDRAVENAPLETPAPVGTLARVASDQVREYAVQSGQNVVSAWQMMPSVEQVVEQFETKSGMTASPARSDREERLPGRAPPRGDSTP